jgi:hypothetical protein
MHPRPEPAAEYSAVLPLPLAPFELYYDFDDGPDYPTTFPVELQFTGPLNREWFERALRETVERHPLLSARIQDTVEGPCWVGEDSAPPLDWNDYDAPIQSPTGDAIDLRTGPGFRTWVRASDLQARVLFQVHHACCDGLAALGCAQEVLARYRILAGDAGAERLLRHVDPQLLMARDALASDQPRKASFWTAIRDAWYTFKVWSSILWRKAEILEPPRGGSNSNPARDLLAFHVKELSPDETSALRKLATASGATTNDLLLRDLLLILRRWNDRQAGRCSGRLRITVPVNVRTRNDAAMPAANRIGYGFVTVRLGNHEEPSVVLDRVCEQTRRIKEWYLGLYFLGGLAFARNFLGLFRRVMRRERSFATAVLSNVARFSPDRSLGPDEKWRCGDLVLEWIGGVPPLRRLTRVGVIAIEYAGRLSLCMRTDPHFFDDASTRELLAELSEQVRESIRHGTRIDASI